MSVTTVVLLMNSVAAWAGTDVWTSLGPEGGSVHGLVLDPGNSNTVYALTNAGLFKSTDGGSNWSMTAPVPANSGRIVSLIIDPRNGSVLYANSEALGPGAPGAVFKSTDGGASWRALKSGLSVGLSAPLAIDPQDPQTIYSGGYNDILKSTDGGETWKTVNSGLPALGCCLFVRSLAIDPQNPATVYAVAGIGIFKSTNRGASWTILYAYSGVVTDPQFASIVIDPQNSKTLYGLHISHTREYRSTDGGASWADTNSGLPDVLSNGILIHPRDSRILYAMTLSGIYGSTDGAQSWFNLVGPRIRGARAMAIDPQTFDTFYAGTESGVFKSTGADATWHAINSGMRALAISRLAFLPAEPGALYAYSPDTSFKSTDGGSSWSQGNFPYPLAIDPRDPATMFAVTAKGLVKTTDGFATFTASSAGLPQDIWTSITSVAIDSQNPEILYAGLRTVTQARNGGVWKSVDGAASWARLDAQPEGGGVYGVAIDPQNTATVYAWNGRGAFKSADGGESWNKLRCGPVAHVAIDSRDSNVLYAVLNDENSVCEKPGIYKSTDGGATWMAINAGLGTIQGNSLRTDVISSLIIDPHDPSTLYAATSQNGVFRSKDAGANWQALNSGQTVLAVHAMALDPQGRSKLYAGTAGGVFAVTLTDTSH